MSSLAISDTKDGSYFLAHAGAADHLVVPSMGSL
eukprot:CAMPEP_0183332998 /NCGR_PEP_ID=MMETSP0164_2-20130417/2021_1 /TAXON_ID=221442 /ORGANISM="Coccolithus pelagicus ssp braarudi, Strain PLY182g" /LENGTH=33 /DNA_ID= /DNA_START= /DNA_END= /DNA_ORIENTATION=